MANFMPYLKNAGETVRKDIASWITSHLSRPEKTLNNLPPCPYAREALLSEQLSIFEPQGDDLEKCLEQIFIGFNNLKKRAAILCCDPQALDLNTCIEMVMSFRRRYAEQDLWLMYDHPAETEKVGDVDFSNGQYLLFFVQQLSDLVGRAKELDQRGYYKNWPSEYYQQVVMRRESFLISTEELLSNARV